MTTRTNKRIARFLNEEEATTSVEYAILLGVIMIAIIKATQILGVQMNGVFEDSGNAIRGAVGS